MHTAFLSFFVLFFAAIMEIAGCYSFWAWIRLEKSLLWILPGTIALWLFAAALTYIECEYAGIAYAAYGAIYIMSAIIWMWVVEKNTPDIYDIVGLTICLIGSLIILYGRDYT